MPCSCKPRFLISITYDVVTEESARIGDYAESGYEVKDKPVCLCEAIDELRPCCEPSVYPAQPGDMSWNYWATTEPDHNQYDGSYTSRSVHLQPLPGYHANPDRLLTLWKLAGIVAR